MATRDLTSVPERSLHSCRPTEMWAMGWPASPLVSNPTMGIRRVQDLKVGPIRADDGCVIPPCHQHNRGVDDVGRSGRPAEHSSSPSTGVGQRLDEDIAKR